MEGLTDVLRLEMRGTGIEVVLIEPGPITSKMREKAIPHFERWIDWKASARRDAVRREPSEAALRRQWPRPLRAARRGGDGEARPCAGKPAAAAALLRHHAHLHRRRAARLLPTRARDWIARVSDTGPAGFGLRFFPAARYIAPEPTEGAEMLQDPLFILVAVATLGVLGILLVGIGGFAKGGDFNKKHANRIMRYRIAAQAVAVVVILIFVFFRRMGGN
jgi:hypothetical protein